MSKSLKHENEIIVSKSMSRTITMQSLTLAAIIAAEKCTDVRHESHWSVKSKSRSQDHNAIKDSNYARFVTCRETLLSM